MPLDDLMAWIILQVHWENGKVGKPSGHLLHGLPLAGPQLPRAEDRLRSPHWSFVGSREKGQVCGGGPALGGGYYAGGNIAGRGVADSSRVSFSTKGQNVCRAVHVKSRVSTGVPPLFKNLISTLKISPSSSLPFIRIQIYSQGWGPSQKLRNHGQVRLWLLTLVFTLMKWECPFHSEDWMEGLSKDV